MSQYSKRINKRFIEQLASQTDLVGLVHSYVPLKKKSGDKHWACCPFHEEKSPSFCVDSHKQFYHCFGCGASGDAIRFLMDYSKLSFVESVETLAQFNNVSIEYDNQSALPNPAKKEQQDKSLQALQAAQEWFTLQLQHQNALHARQYLEKRGLHQNTIAQFQLGYAPAHNALLEHLQKRFDLKTLLDAGLIGEKDGRYFDWFRDRLMFPIHNMKGQVVGFGARAFGEGQPKYLNSPETPYFSKRFELYGLYQAMHQTPRPKQLIVTEGYMDVIKLWQHGIKEAVAALGTAIGETHIAQLKKRTEKAYFAFDGDTAGQKAAAKALEAIFMQHDERHNWRFVFMPQGEDPDSLLDKHGTEAFHTLLDNAKTPSQFLVQILDDGLGDKRSVEAQANLVAHLSEWLAKLPDGAYKKLLSQETLKAFNLQSDGLILPSQPKRERFNQALYAHKAHTSAPASKDLRLLALISLQPELAYELQSALYPEALNEQFPHAFALAYALQQAGANHERVEKYLNHHHLTHELAPLLNTLRELTPQQQQQELHDIPNQTAQRWFARQKSRISKPNLAEPKPVIEA